VIVKGKSRSGPVALALHLENAETNESVILLETKGTVAHDLRGALVEMDALALGTRCEKSLYHASISPQPPHRLSPRQRGEAVAALEEKLGLSGHARVVVLHEKDGREHLHVVWSRIDLNRMAATSDSHNYRKHEEVARDLERRFGHDRIQGAHHERHGVRRPARTPSRAELRQEDRTGIRGQRVRSEVSGAFRSSESADSFRRALHDLGYILARGDRRDFVIVDPAGGIHSLARRIEGVTQSELRAFMADLDPASIPAIRQAKAAMAPASTHLSAPLVAVDFSASRPLANDGGVRLHRLGAFQRCGTSLTGFSGRAWRSGFRSAAVSLNRPIRFAVLRRQRRRRRVREMKAAWRYFLPRRRRRPVLNENELMRPIRRRSGPMSLYELICWHRANGTLALFLRSLGL
jgi:hypothetical protein